ncbi:MAG: oligosaccharide flippase family protein [Candidatus Kapaibacterium sp.]
MQLQHHIAKISWTLADKVLYVVYGFVFLIKISLLSTDNLALFGFLTAFNTWIFVIGDSFALQSIIQYGFEHENRKKVNTFALIIHSVIVLSLTFLISYSGSALAGIMDEPRIDEITYYLPILTVLMLPRTFCLKLMLREHNMSGIFMSNFVFFGVMVAYILYYKFTGQMLNLDSAAEIYLYGTGASSIVSIVIAWRMLEFSFTGNIKLKDIVSFSLPFTITNAINTIPKYLDILILKLFFPLDQIGIYSAAKSLFKFFEEGMNGVNGLVYPAAVRAVTSGDKVGLHSIVSKAVSFTLILFAVGAVILTLGLSDILIAYLMKAKFIDAATHFKLLLIATLFLPFNILYFVITASGKHYDLMRIVAISFAVSVLSFIIIGVINKPVLMPLGYVAFYGAFAFQAIRFVNINQIVVLSSRDIFRAFDDTIKYAEKMIRKL